MSPALIQQAETADKSFPKQTCITQNEEGREKGNIVYAELDAQRKENVLVV